VVLKALGLLLGFVLFAAAGVGAFIYSGLYDVAADRSHTRAGHALLETVRERSIARRARRIDPPDLTDDASIRRGSGNYEAMCAGCHLAPGVSATELSRGLYPAPPAFTKTGIDDPAAAFWVIKHGIKSTGMPAWGESMSDESIWELVAFLRTLPKLDVASYRAIVAASPGHSHEPPNGDASGHDHERAGADHHHH
jgi:mono/diheme cytochrome c family protein